MRSVDQHEIESLRDIEPCGQRLVRATVDETHRTGHLERIEISADALGLADVRRDADMIRAACGERHRGLAGAGLERVHARLDQIGEKAQHVARNRPVGGRAIRPGVERRLVLEQLFDDHLVHSAAISLTRLSFSAAASGGKDARSPSMCARAAM